MGSFPFDFFSRDTCLLAFVHTLPHRRTPVKLHFRWVMKNYSAKKNRLHSFFFLNQNISISSINTRKHIDTHMCLLTVCVDCSLAVVQTLERRSLVRKFLSCSCCSSAPRVLNLTSANTSSKVTCNKWVCRKKKYRIAILSCEEDRMKQSRGLLITTWCERMAGAAPVGYDLLSKLMIGNYSSIFHFSVSVESRGQVQEFLFCLLGHDVSTTLFGFLQELA